jgi:hypothetical protein
MTYNATKKQLFVKEEPTEFTANSHGGLPIAANAAFLPFDASIEWDPDFFSRDVVRINLAKAPKIAGKQTGRIKASVELTASGSVIGSLPQFHSMLRACGLRYSALVKITASGLLTGTGATNKVIRHGTIVTETSGSIIYQVVGDVHLPDTPSAGTVTIWVGRLEGIGVGTLATGSDLTLTYKGVAAGTIASADFSAVTVNAAAGYWPYSTALTKVLFDATGLTSNVLRGDIIRGVTSRAVARVVKDTALGANTSLYVEMISGHFSTAEVISHLTSGDADVGTLAAAAFEVQTSIPSLTVGLNEDGIFQSLAGCRGNATFVFEGSRPVRINFEFSGVKNGVSDVALVEGITFTQHNPPVWKASAMVLGPFNSDLTSTDQSTTNNYAPCVSKMELATGNNLTARECSNATEGIVGYVIDDRVPTLSMDPLVTAEADFGWLTKMQASSVIRGSWNVGSTAPDKFIFGFPAGQPVQVPASARGKEAARNVKLELTAGPQDTDSGDNEYWLIWQIG